MHILKLLPIIYHLINNSFARQFAGTVDVLTECPQAEIHACILLIQQDAGDGKTVFCLIFLQSGEMLRRQNTFAVGDEHDISVVEAPHPG